MMLESPFLHKLDTNYAPSPKEVEEIKQTLLEPEKTLRALKEEIARLQAEQDELQSFVDGHRSLLSPIRRAPNRYPSRNILFNAYPDDRLPIRTLPGSAIAAHGHLSVVARSCD
ncbi:hypothetical protein MPER_04181, partial [Moniliophthora perniciosa FA553]